MEFEHDSAAKARFENILRISFNTFVSQIGPEFGVSRRINYSKLGSDTGFSKFPAISSPRRRALIGFRSLYDSSGWELHPLLVEPPIFLEPPA